MKNLIKLGLIVIGASALTLTMASATCGSGKVEKKEMKCQAGKCGTDKKDVKKKEMKCNGGKEMKKDAEKKGEAKGKCGQGKCGSK